MSIGIFELSTTSSFNPCGAQELPERRLARLCVSLRPSGAYARHLLDPANCEESVLINLTSKAVKYITGRHDDGQPDVLDSRYLEAALLGRHLVFADGKKRNSVGAGFVGHRFHSDLGAGIRGPNDGAGNHRAGRIFHKTQHRSRPELRASCRCLKQERKQQAKAQQGKREGVHCSA